ncbi:MAG TPA: hypothetical protein VJW20_20260 [Candidatus Angelobacter sp.]|nr:hypothetical protein [Candidatus Angelobacter sp.]
MKENQIYAPGRRVDFAGAGVSPVQGKIDVALSQFAQLYRNNTFVAEALFPRVEVLKQTDLFWTFGRENQALRENTLRAPTAAAERIQQTLSKNPYSTTDHALARLISDEERGNFMAGDLEQWATQTIMDKLMLDEEVRAAAIALNAANYAGTNNVMLAGASQWSAYLTNNDLSNPIQDVETAKSQIRQIGQEANVMIIGDPVYKALRAHPQIVDRFKFVNGGQITLQQLAQVFGIERVLLASAIQLDQANNASFVWGKSAVLAYAQPNSNFYDVSFGKTFVWTQAPGTVGGFATEIARLTPASAKADELASHFYYGQQVTSNISGYLILNAVA